MLGQHCCDRWRARLRRARETAVNRLVLGAVVGVVLGCAVGANAQIGPPVRFFGAINQDGCPFCCEFVCQATPTPTPEFDAQGRQIFRQNSGSLLLVAEAGLGPSNRHAGSEGVYSSGSVQAITNASGRPSVLAAANGNLGNGSPQVDCRTIPLGGVPGRAGWLNFPAGADVTTALIDMACRFELSASSAVACTRDRFGNFDFLGSGTTRQFCFQVPQIAAFPLGDTIVALEFLDTSGNPGPRKEIVIRVDPHGVGGGGPTATPTPTPTPTPTSANISGRIRYYSADRPVPNAFVQLTNGALRSTTTNATGNYMFTNLTPGNAIVEPRKTGDFGTPSAITALDASWVLQAVAGTRPFDLNQRLAGDVTGDGSISALDATRILQRQVGLLARFVVADRCNSDWLYRPMPGAALNQRIIEPLISTGTCRRGAIAYEPLVGNAPQQDFLGILFGDVTGNWQPPVAGAALRAQEASGYRLRVRSARPAGMGGSLRLPLAIKGSEPFYSLDVTITYDNDVLRPIAVKKLRAAGSALAVFNLARPGVVRIAVASAEPMPFGLSVVALDFQGVAPSDAIRVTRANVDDQPAEIVD
jgi:hypothetical protein